MPSVSLADVIFWVAVVCCAVAQWFIVRLALVAPTAPASAAPAGRVVPRTRRAAEIVWAVLPAVVLALVLAATWRAIRPGGAPASAHPPAEHTAAWERGQGPVTA